MHTPEPLLNDCSSIQVSKLLFTIVRRLMSSVVGWNDLNIRSRGTLDVVPELPINSQLSTTPSCPVRIGFVSARLNRHRFDSVLSMFNVVSLSDYDHTCGFQYVNTNSHVRNLTFPTQNTMLYTSLSLAPHFILLIPCNNRYI